MLIRILFVSLCCLGRHRPARKCRSQRSCWTKGGIQESDATLLGLFVFHFLALIDLVAGETREAMNVTDSLIGWEVKMQHLLSTFRKESKDWDTFTSSVFNFLSKKPLQKCLSKTSSSVMYLKRRQLKIFTWTCLFNYLPANGSIKIYILRLDAIRIQWNAACLE